MSVPELIEKLRADVKSKKPDYGPGGGGDACCTPLETPDQTLKGFIPRINEVIFGFISEDANMGEG